MWKVEEEVGTARSDQLAYGDCDNTQRPEGFETLAPSPTVVRVAVMATGSNASLEAATPAHSFLSRKRRRLQALRSVDGSEAGHTASSVERSA